MHARYEQVSQDQIVAGVRDPGIYILRSWLPVRTGVFKSVDSIKYCGQGKKQVS